MQLEAIDLIANWQTYFNEIVSAGLFSSRLYLQEVVQPTLKAWDISRVELKALADANDEPDLEKRAQPKLNFLKQCRQTAMEKNRS